MATLKHADSRRLYSWWWNSHISPKNSKWLQENLSDMDMKVKAMIKLIEEDADSFARRAEMYYKKRPELMKLVEEFYRAYRALAERYDHATGALRQAHRTMAEAFPNQIPFVLPDESPTASSSFEPEPHSPETPRSIKRNGAHSEEKDVLTRRKGLKQLNEVYGKLSEGEDSGDQIRCLQEEVSRLSKENQNLQNQVASESVRADRAEAQVQSLKDSISKLESEKEAALLQYHPSPGRISNLETEISCTQEEFKKHNNDMLMCLEEEMRHLKEENESLNEQNLSSGLKINNLQQHKNELEEKHHGLAKQMDAVSSNVESLQALVKELQDGNIQMKELCKQNEDEKILQFQNMEKISEKNIVLENSLSDANAELEALREKIKTLETSCESLHDKISVHISEKAVLVSQIEGLAQNMEKLSDKNTLLENSLSDVNIELEASRQKLKGLEDSYQSLSDHKSNLLSEKSALVSQVESINQSLKIMEKRYAELEDKHSNLEKENESTLLHVTELQDSLKLQKQEHEVLIQSSNSKLLTLENHINLLQNEGRLREEEFEVGQLNTMNAQIENLIFQSCMCDMKEENMILSMKCKKLLEKSRLAEEQISKLDQEHLLLQEKITILSEQNEKLRKGVHLIMEALNVHKENGFSDSNKDESLLHLILCEIRSLLDTISNSQNENQLLLLENSVLNTLLKQFGLDMTDLRHENYDLQQESNIKIEELAALQNMKQELLKMNEQLILNLHSSNKTEEQLKSEKENLCEKLSNMEETYHALLEDNCSLSKKFYDMSEKNNTLEQENNVMLAEAMKLEHLYLIFGSYNAERALDLKSLADDLDSLHKIRNGLDQRVRQMDERMGALELENVHLKKSIVSLDDDLKKASLHIDMKNGLMKQQDIELSQANQRFQFSEDKNIELRKEVKELKGREEDLTSELKKGTTEFQKSELEFAALLDGIHMAMVHATIFEEKILELLLACESLEIGALVQKEVLLSEITSRNSCADELKGMLSALEAENRGLKADLNAYLPLIMSLWESMASLEECTVSLAKHRASIDQEDQVDRNSQESSEDHNVPPLSGLVELEKLLAKVEAVRKVVTDTGMLLEKERSDSHANLAAAEKEIEDLKSEIISRQEKHDRDVKLQEDNADISQVRDDEVMKDIPLDHVRSPPCGSGVSSMMPDVGKDDQMLELWEIVEKEERSNHPSSEIVLEKELSIDKLESLKKVGEPHQEWNKRVLKGLASDAERLSLLQTSVEELKRRIESSEINNHPSSFEFQSVVTQTKEAEAAISQLIDFNNKLAKKAEKFSGSTESLVSEHDEKGSGKMSRRQISERARRGSERIGRLELELQKIQYVMLKLEEEHKYYRARAAGRRRSVLLRDYLYGRKDSRGAKKAPFCACVRPSTEFE